MMTPAIKGTLSILIKNPITDDGTKSRVTDNANPANPGRKLLPSLCRTEPMPRIVVPNSWAKRALARSIDLRDFPKIPTRVPSVNAPTTEDSHSIFLAAKNLEQTS
jgi:hypothetical protein